MKGPDETPEGGDELADVVSFAAKARQRGHRLAGDRIGDEDPYEATDGDGAPPAAAITTGAMRRRLQQLAGPHAYQAVDDKLAELVFDSADDEPAGRQASVRGVDAAVAATRQLTFEGPDLLLEVQIDGRNRELTCQVVPPQPASLEIRHASGTIDLGRDQFGTFYTPQVPAGAVSLRCVAHLVGETATATSWVNL
ncbi:MAG TPA: hypothetical protein VGP46_04730 [Acidimicrobiales bacterium]|nr:hypothetical protein [Acidimicrobiales bacterium]